VLLKALGIISVLILVSVVLLPPHKFVSTMLLLPIVGN